VLTSYRLLLLLLVLLQVHGAAFLAGDEMSLGQAARLGAGFGGRGGGGGGKDERVLR
jgi:hypothetical protein